MMYNEFLDKVKYEMASQGTMEIIDGKQCLILDELAFEQASENVAHIIMTPIDELVFKRLAEMGFNIVKTNH